MLALLLGIEITTLFLGIKSFVNKNNTLDDIKLLDNKSNNLFAIMIQDKNGDYKESDSFPEGKYVINETLSSCIDSSGSKINTVFTYENGLVTLDVDKTISCYLYFDEDLIEVYDKVIDDYNNSKGVEKITDENGKEIYYYTGDITNNNLVLNNYCWKMVRTSETDGVKLLYNGVLNEITEINALDKNKYNVTTNTPAETLFTFDETTKKWTSGIAGVADAENIIEFTVTETGDYLLNYEVSSQENYDKVSFYKNETELKVDLSGTVYGSIELNGLSTSDVIKVVYKKDNSADSNKDMISFSVGVPTGGILTNCDNTGSGVYVNSTGNEFNENGNSPVYVGYMYGNVYNFGSKDNISYQAVNRKGFITLGSDVTWNGTTYTLSDAESSLFGNSTVLNNKHYTCLSTSASCETVYYVYYLTANSPSYVLYYVVLTNGKKIEDALDEMLNYNTTNSNIKTVIDNWYSANMTNVTDYLENAIYCNNRHITELGGWNPSGGSVTDYLYFNDYTNNSARLTCQDKEDQFTLKVDSGGTLGYGNNALDYPVGLLTNKEAKLCFGSSSTNYLNNGGNYWLLSPLNFNRSSNGYYVSNGSLGVIFLSRIYYGVRPVVSLKKNIKISGGTGEIDDPYTVRLS